MTHIIDTEEQWADVEGFDGKYRVSTIGRVTGRGGKILKPGNVRGYMMLNLRAPGRASKNSFVHRLVATAFIPNPDNKRTVNHKDGVRDNNVLSNLEWATDRENMIHTYAVLTNFPNGGKLTIPQVLRIRDVMERATDKKVTERELAREYDVQPWAIYKVWKRMSYWYVTPEYIERLQALQTKEQSPDLSFNGGNRG